jgi:hypothetical protein
MSRLHTLRLLGLYSKRLIRGTTCVLTSHLNQIVCTPSTWFILKGVRLLYFGMPFEFKIERGSKTESILSACDWNQVLTFCSREIASSEPPVLSRKCWLVSPMTSPLMQIVYFPYWPFYVKKHKACFRNLVM